MTVRKLVAMRETLESPDYFHGLIGGDSWAAWRVLLIAIMGEALTDAERVVFQELTGREHEPGEPVEEFWGIIGRRGGKTRAFSVLAAYLAACIDYRGILAPGERGVLPVMAASVWQAQQAFNFTAGVFDTAPRLHGLVENATAGTIPLTTGVDIQIRPASFRTIRSITAIAAIADEIAFWHSDNSVNPDKEILDALRPALATTGGPLIAISSPYARRGELYNAFRRHYGPAGDKLILVAKAPTLTMHPTLPKRVIERAYERDPSAAAAEYGAEFRTDVETFVAREVIDAAVTPGRFELPPIPGVRYIAFVDPSGGSKDSMTLAVAHRAKDDRVILDAIREAKPPFSPDGVVQEFAELLKSYGIAKVTGDRYAGEWPRERFRVHGIAYELSEQPKSDIYRDTLPLLNSGRVELLDNQRVIIQFCGLERRTARGGKDSIDHAPGAHDDVANSVAGALLLASAKKKPMVVSDEALAFSRRPGPPSNRHSQRPRMSAGGFH